MRAHELTVFFVVQKGALSLRARFLALSLRRFMSPYLHLRAAIPEDTPPPDDETLDLLAALGVQFEVFEPDLMKRHAYPIGNKIDAATLPFRTRYALFLDSDMLMMRNFATWKLGEPQLSARPIFGAQAFAGKGARAIEAFATERLGIDPAEYAAREPQFSSRAETFFAVCNSGAVLFDTETDFATRWRDVADQVLSSDLPKGLRHPYADQAALALVMAEGRHSFQWLPRFFNSSVSSDRTPILMHYFRFPSALARPDSHAIVLELQEEAARKGFNALGELTVKDLAYFRRPPKLPDNVDPVFAMAGQGESSDDEGSDDA
ncbi:hypothetical protein [Halodurantibacterium flavum]|uniref:Glycosyl transferase family 8 n=1 Tax=Halodurantibacterium flavum TaxID=1382802 RepID=A0ABW4S0L4_9RHOB